MPAEDNYTKDVHEQDTPLKNLTYPEREHNPMGPSVLDNMEISMVHVLPAKLQPTASQQNFLDGDVVTEEETHVDFVATNESSWLQERVYSKQLLPNCFHVPLWLICVTSNQYMLRLILKDT